MPPPKNYGSVIHALEKDSTNDPPLGGYVEGTKWAFPPPLKDWEKAVGMVRPTQDEMKAEVQANEEAVRKALESEEETTKPPPGSHHNIMISLPGFDIKPYLEFQITRKVFHIFFNKFKWFFTGLGAKEDGILAPVNAFATYDMGRDNPDPDPEYQYFRPCQEAVDEDKYGAFWLDTCRQGSFPFQVEEGQGKAWDFIAKKFPPKAEETKAEEMQVEAAPKEPAENEGYDDDYGLAFDYMFNEQPQSEASKVAGWQLAAEDVTILRTVRPSSSAATEPIPPVFNETWKHKIDGRVIETITSQSRTQVSAPQLPSSTSEDQVMLDDQLIPDDNDDLPPLPPSDDEEKMDES